MSAWDPVCPPGCVPLGTAVVPSFNAPGEALVAYAPWLDQSKGGRVDDVSPSDWRSPVAPAVGFDRVYGDSGSRLKKNPRTGEFIFISAWATSMTPCFLYYRHRRRLAPEPAARVRRDRPRHHTEPRTPGPLERRVRSCGPRGAEFAGAGSAVDDGGGRVKARYVSFNSLRMGNWIDIVFCLQVPFRLRCIARAFALARGGSRWRRACRRISAASPRRSRFDGTPGRGFEWRTRANRNRVMGRSRRL